LRFGDPDGRGEVNALEDCSDAAPLGFVKKSSEKMSVNRADLQSVEGEVGVRGLLMEEREEASGSG
jgi:hypothetical protein